MSASLLATLSLRVGILAALLTAGGAGAAHLRWVSPYLGFRIFGLGLLVCGLSALILGAIALFRVRRSSESGRVRSGDVRPALFGTLLGAAHLGLLIALIAPHLDAPPIHDLTTSPADPPVFREIARLPENQERDLTYPHGGSRVIALQKAAYPDLETIRVPILPDRAFDQVRHHVEKMGWTLVWSNRELGIIEASQTSEVFRFVDDIAIRIRNDAGGTAIDVRSTSRVGVSDLGANARRIRALVARLKPGRR